MIEAHPFRPPNPSHAPIGSEHQAWSRQIASTAEDASDQDDILRNGPHNRSNMELAVGLQARNGVVEGFGDDCVRDKIAVPERSSRRTSVQSMRGNVTLGKPDKMQSGASNTVDEDTVLPRKMPFLESDSGYTKPLENRKRQSSQVDSNLQPEHKDQSLMPTPERIDEVTSTAKSVPLRASISSPSRPNITSLPPPSFDVLPESQSEVFAASFASDSDVVSATSIQKSNRTTKQNALTPSDELRSAQDRLLPAPRPAQTTRAFSSPSIAKGRQSTPFQTGIPRRRTSKHTPAPLRFEDGKPAGLDRSIMEDILPSPMPKTIPLPPLSLPTYLQLELSSHRPSPLYIHRSMTSDFPYESSRVKIERLLNFLLLPPQLEQVLWFGTFACLDAWLYTFTILPLRLLKSFYILSQSWVSNLIREVQFISNFIYAGTGRMWKRRRTRGNSACTDQLRTTLAEELERPKSVDTDGFVRLSGEKRRPSFNKRNTTDESGRKLRRHRRAKSVPSSLLPDDTADILKGLLIISTCLILMRLDASRMYHWIRGQAAIKLYVIYNVLEVGDRLLSAIGQDVLECLFSRETLERAPDGHSKVLRPFWLFLLALTYTVVHATALFYQVITLNVAVNSYSNALITLLMSNQFVEIKSTVFKKFEKENLFQLTCADVVERFQLWLMLLIIASRNIVETGGLSVGLNAFSSSSSSSSSFSPTGTNSSNPLHQPPRSATSILPRSFTLLPSILSSLTTYAPGISHVLGPFLVVLGSEMLVDWLKHSYINKFNNTRPAIYGRFLDVLAKDYYSNAFAEQNLTKRLGLPVIPLSCLFIRASVQTYHMFLAAWIPSTLPPTTSPTASSSSHFTGSAPTSTSTAAALSHQFDLLLKQIPASITSSPAFAHFSSILIFLLIFLVLLVLKLLLGMLLLVFARARYRAMKRREEEEGSVKKKDPGYHVEGGRRVGGWGVVEVDEDKRRWIYEGDEEGMKLLREREERERVKREKGSRGTGGEEGFERVKRYEMVAKRIW